MVEKYSIKMLTKRDPKAWLALLVLCGFGGLLGLGCAATSKPTEVATCQVFIDNTVALEVRLTLFKIEAGQAIPVFEGASAPDGTISLKPGGQADKTNHGASELVGMIESTGSSEWQLAAPWSSPLTSPLKVQWPPTDRPVKISLPRKAIRII